MKKSLLLASNMIALICGLLVTVNQVSAQSNWSSQMPKPLGFTVFDASFVDANNGWATGEAGAIAKTTNGGATWTNKNIPLFTGNGLTNFRPALNQIQFLNTSVGYAVGPNAAFLKTTDGGTTWKYVNGPLGPVSSTGKGLNNLFFFDTNNGWVVGDAPNASQSLVYKTSDGGLTWSAPANLPIINNNFYGIDFFDPMNGYIVGANGKVLRTTDGGVNWSDISLTTTNYTVVGGTLTLPRSQTYRCVLALDANTAIMSSQNNGCVLRTTNGGTSWYASGNQAFGIPQMATWQMAKAGPNNDTILIAGGQARLAKSTDRGLTWTTQQHYTPSTNSYNYYYSVTAVPNVPGKYIMMGASGIINVSTNGGATWTNPYSSVGTYDGTGSSDARNLFALSFADANNGMAAGAMGTLVTTNNAGTTWTDRSIASMSNLTGNPDYITSIKCVTATTAFLCTSNMGLIMKTSDFGVTWTTQLDMQGSDAMMAMDFIDANNGWVVSGLGNVYKTTNGSTWTQMAQFTTSQMNAVDFIDANTGWVVGASGKIFKTTNGGTTWTAQTSGITNALYSVQFLNANLGFAAGASGKVLMTTDGGATWVQRNITTTTTQLTRIVFFDANKGIAIGWGGVEYSTADGGLSWNPLYAPTADNLQDAVQPAGSNNIFIAGGGAFGVHGDILTLDNSMCTSAITEQPLNTTVCAGTTANFNITTYGSLFAAYQWQLSTNGGGTWANIAGATSSYYSFTTSGTESGYQYRCVVTNSCGAPTSTTSNAATLTFSAAPAITQQPSNVTACLGNSAIFSVAATGTGLTYQWQNSTNGGGTWTNVTTGTTYSGANTNTLTVIATTAAMQANQFRCVVTGQCSPVANSNGATLTLPVTIATQPANATVCASTNTSFTITTSGSGVTYGWQVSTDGGTTFTYIGNGGVYSGTTTATLNITGATAAMNNYRYRCVATSGVCSTTSNAAALTVNTAPAITVQPVPSVGGCPGQVATLIVSATGTALTYQWQVSTDNGATFTNVINSGIYAGATTNSLAISNTIPAMNNYQYKCMISGACTPGVTSAISTLVIAAPAAITSSPVPQTVCSGSVASFSVATTGSVASYQWQVLAPNGASFTDIPGANTNTLNVTTNVAMSTSQYRCVVNAYCNGQLMTTAAQLLVNALPAIAIQASPYTDLLPNQRTNLSIQTITPAAAATYTWKKNGVTVSNAATLSNLGVEDAGIYSLSVTDVNGCSGVSNNITIGTKESGKLFMYPDPSSGKFQVHLYSTTNTPRSIVIYDNRGSKIFIQQYPINGPYDKMDVNISNAASGIYEVVVLDNSGARIAGGKLMIYH